MSIFKHVSTAKNDFILTYNTNVIARVLIK